MVENVTSDYPPFLVADEKAPPERPSQKYHVKTHHLDNAFPSIKTRDLIAGIWFNTYA
jgi:hypothetical protein